MKKRKKSKHNIPDSWMIVTSSERHRQLVKAGIRLCVRKRVEWAPVSASSSLTQKATTEAFYGPRWAVNAPPDTTIEQLRKAKRSKTERQALITLGQLYLDSNGEKLMTRAEAKAASYAMHYGADAPVAFERAVQRSEET